MIKKTLLGLALCAGMGLALTACNKDYTCVCTLNGVETYRETVRAKTKNAAEDKCNEMQSSGGVTYECAIE
ncbi:MAG: hypothetical protein QM642_05970 [Edaphocola sp.]